LKENNNQKESSPMKDILKDVLGNNNLKVKEGQTLVEFENMNPSPLRSKPGKRSISRPGSQAKHSTKKSLASNFEKMALVSNSPLLDGTNSPVKRFELD